MFEDVLDALDPHLDGLGREDVRGLLHQWYEADRRNALEDARAAGSAFLCEALTSARRKKQKRAAERAAEAALRTELAAGELEIASWSSRP